MKLCNLEMSKTLQEMGYDGEYTMCYIKDSEEPFVAYTPIANRKFVAPAPRLDDAAYFLRDKYGIFIDIRYARENIRKCGKWSWAYILKEMDSMSAQYGDTFYSAHDDALQAAVTKAIEIIQKQKQ